ncbi:exosome component 10 isoform X1 [Latimeria chalumnae]|uniref:Exosome complex component 10 n=1 Tax=Latimeria chalumnae TaxID=7897 RepID=H3BAQ0_LATCH|nr:PREDICTED: exosome component 10 isoform X1 [Latimeria chalumnae]|eukprot:XP_005994065.1 PREDICTED: exosome component 10 isoform X1 [Latimeria chalumnae]
MAVPSSGVGSGTKSKTGTAENEEKEGEVIPGFKDADSFVKYALGTVVTATKASGGLPQAGDEYDFYCSFPGFRAFCESQGDRLLKCMSQLMQYHGCRSHIRDCNKVTELEDKFDLLVDSNDVILERVGIFLDEASGVNKNQQPVLPVGLQPPKTIVSSWNRKGSAANKSKSETFRLLHAKNIPRPQIKFREKIDNSNTPFVPKIFIKPNALKPLPQVLRNRRAWEERPEDLDVPPALADFIHQQRTQQNEQDMLAHPYQYELDHFVPAETLLKKPEPQMYKPLSETSCHFINNLDELVELNEKLCRYKEFAVDLEHHSYRSFLGLTCLMQISTRDEDFIIDTLELRSDLYILNEAFTDPAIVKIFHGADSDVEWLQRDLGLYVVNMFDTHQAARILNLGRNSLDHLLKLYCSVESDKRYQLADWRIRPLPEEMLQYAREDTHYLLFIYDKMRAELWDKGNGQLHFLQMVWQKSKEICLKRYIKPIFTEDSYLELCRKQKKQLNSQQLMAVQLLYAWRDKMSRHEDESTGYVLPNHMLMKIAEELPKEPQGIVACCNPIPPSVRQQVNELHLLVQQAREIPLLKTEILAREKKKGLVPKPERTASLFFGPHDDTHLSTGDIPVFPTSAPILQKSSLFSDEEEMEEAETLPSSSSLLATATISVFNYPEDEEKTLTTAQQKASSIMESFENPFRMYLPPEDNKIHISKNAKFDPSSKVYEISNRWKLVSQEQLQKEAKAKMEAKAKASAQKSAVREQIQKDYKAAAEEVISVRQQAAMAQSEQVTKKRERVAHEPGSLTPKQEKKRPKPSQQPAEKQTPKQFTPFDYSKSDFKVFAGGSKSKESSQFDPNKQAQPVHQSKKLSSKHRSSAGNKSMSYLGGRSERGFKHKWPKR